MKLTFSSPISRLLILLLLLLAFGLRAYRLDEQSLRGDEAATVLYAALPVSQLWEHSRVTDPHPPLYYLMLNPWQRLFGESAWAMRFAGASASLLAVAALHRLARLTLQRAGAGLLAAALLAVNPLQIWLAQDVRSYPFFTLLGLLSSWALWRALQSKTQTSKLAIQSPWPLYILTTLACFYIHYYTVFLIAFQGLFALVNAKKFWPQKWPWLASQIIIALLMIPGLQLAYNFVGQAAGGIETIATPELLREASASLLTGFTIGDSWGLWVSLALAPLWIIGAITLLRHNITSGVFWTLFFAVPVLGVIALSINRPFFKERFLIQGQPAFELLLAIGFLTLWGKVSGFPLARTGGFRVSGVNQARYALRATYYVLRLTALLLLALLLTANAVALANYFADPAYAKAPPWHLYHNYVARKMQPGDVMLTNFPEASVSYYSPNGLPFYVAPVERDRSTAYRLEQTEQIAGAYRRIWFLPLLNQGFDEQGDVLNWLDRHADRVDQIFFPGYHLNLYLSPPALEAGMIQQRANFAHGLHLRGFQILDEQGRSRLDTSGDTPALILIPEEAFTLSLYWQTGAPTHTPYTVFTHLIAADGFNRAGQDNQPVWGSYPTTQWSPGEKITDKYTLTVPPGAPPGDHRLRVGWYQADTLERVPLLDNAGQPVADHLILDVIIRVAPPASAEN